MAVSELSHYMSGTVVTDPATGREFDLSLFTLAEFHQEHYPTFYFCEGRVDDFVRDYVRMVLPSLERPRFVVQIDFCTDAYRGAMEKAVWDDKPEGDVEPAFQVLARRGEMSLSRLVHV
jgi:hypothetical protein